MPVPRISPAEAVRLLDAWRAAPTRRADLDERLRAHLLSLKESDLPPTAS